jgi:DNA-directed RNA polymerase specialized sigma24 family protein
VLRYYLDLSVSETADVMGCAEGTVKSLTSRALGQLGHVLSPDEEREVRQ